MKKVFLTITCLLVLCNVAFGAMQTLKVSSDRRSLEYANGTPFFWMGDTAWHLPRVNPTDILTYLDNRRDNGFNVIQITASNFDLELYVLPGYNNQHPLTCSPPCSSLAINETYWQHIDYIVDEAAKRNLYVVLFAAWGFGIGGGWQPGMESTLSYQYGQFLGNRYRAKNNVIYSVAGEYETVSRSYEIQPTTTQLGWLDELGKGIESSKGTNQLITIKGAPQSGASTYFKNSSWLDFYGLHISHRTDLLNTLISETYNQTGSDARPSVNLEPGYEDGGWASCDHCSNTKTPWGQRYTAYMGVFLGLTGYTYGHDRLAAMSGPSSDPWALPGGRDQGQVDPAALNDTASLQMKHFKKLMESVSFNKRTPDQSIITSSTGSFGDPPNKIVATVSSGKTWALVYLSQGGSVTIDMSKFSDGVDASWYNPRDGTETSISNGNSNSGTKAFTSTSSGANNDWVLVLRVPASISKVQKWYLTPDGSGENYNDTGSWKALPNTIGNAMSKDNFNSSTNWSATEDPNKLDPDDIVFVKGSGWTDAHDLIPVYGITLDGKENGNYDPKTESPTLEPVLEMAAILVNVDHVTVQDLRFGYMQGNIPRSAGICVDVSNYLNPTPVPIRKNSNIKILRNYFHAEYYNDAPTVVWGFVCDSELVGNYFKAFHGNSWPGCSGHGRGSSIHAGSRNKITDNVYDGGYTAHIWWGKKDFNHDGVIDVLDQSGTYAYDPDANFQENEVARNHVPVRCEEGLTMDPYTILPSVTPIVEKDQVKAISGKTITLGYDHNRWTGVGDRYSGLFMVAIEPYTDETTPSSVNDGKSSKGDNIFGKNALIVDHNDAVFTFERNVSDLFPGLGVGDHVQISLVFRHNWVHHNTFGGEGYVGFAIDSIHFEGCVVENLVEYNSGPDGIVQETGGHGVNLRSTHALSPNQNSVTNQAGVGLMAFNIIRYNTLDSVLMQVWDKNLQGTPFPPYPFVNRNNAVYDNNFYWGVRLSNSRAYVKNDTVVVSDNASYYSDEDPTLDVAQWFANWNDNIVNPDPPPTPGPEPEPDPDPDPEPDPGPGDTTRPFVSFAKAKDTTVETAFSEKVNVDGYKKGDLWLVCDVSGNLEMFLNPQNQSSVYSFCLDKNVVPGERCKMKYVGGGVSIKDPAGWGLVHPSNILVDTGTRGRTINKVSKIRVQISGAVMKELPGGAKIVNRPLQSVITPPIVPDISTSICTDLLPPPEPPPPTEPGMVSMTSAIVQSDARTMKITFPIQMKKGTNYSDDDWKLAVDKWETLYTFYPFFKSGNGKKVWYVDTGVTLAKNDDVYLYYDGDGIVGQNNELAYLAKIDGYKVNTSWTDTPIDPPIDETPPLITSLTQIDKRKLEVKSNETITMGTGGNGTWETQWKNAGYVTYTGPINSSSSNTIFTGSKDVLADDTLVSWLDGNAGTSRSNPVAYADTSTIGLKYTPAQTNGWQDLAGNLLAAFKGKTISNRVDAPADTKYFCLSVNGNLSCDSHNGKKINPAFINEPNNYSSVNTSNPDLIDPDDVVFVKGGGWSNGFSPKGPCTIDLYEAGDFDPETMSNTIEPVINSTIYVNVDGVTIQDGRFKTWGNGGVVVGWGNGLKISRTRILRNYFKDSGKWRTLAFGFVCDSEIAFNKIENQVYSGCFGDDPDTPWIDNIGYGSNGITISGGSRNKIHNNQIYGAAVAIFLTTSANFDDYRETMDIPSSGSYKLDPDFSFHDNEIAYNTVHWRCGEGISLDTFGSDDVHIAGYGGSLFERDTVASVSGNTVTLSHPGWASAGDRYSGAYMINLANTDAKYGQYSLITGHSNNTFTLQSPISNLAVGDMVTITMVFKNNWIHHNKWPDTLNNRGNQGYGGSSLLFEGTSLENLIEHNEFTQRDYTEGNGLSLSPLDSYIQWRGSVTGTWGTQASAFNIIRNNLSGNMNIGYLNKGFDGTTAYGSPSTGVTQRNNAVINNTVRAVEYGRARKISSYYADTYFNGNTATIDCPSSRQCSQRATDPTGATVTYFNNWPNFTPAWD